MQKCEGNEGKTAQKVEYRGTLSEAKSYVSLRMCDAAVEAYFRGQKDVRMRVTVA
jgi:hypothetical protein